MTPQDLPGWRLNLVERQAYRSGSVHRRSQRKFCAMSSGSSCDRPSILRGQERWCQNFRPEGKNKVAGFQISVCHFFTRRNPRRTSEHFHRGNRDTPAFCQVHCSLARLEVDNREAGVPRLKSQQRHGHSRKLPAVVQQRHPGEIRERARLQAGRRHQRYRLFHQDNASGRDSTSQHAEGLSRVTGDFNRAKVATCDRSRSTATNRQRTPQLQAGMGEGRSR